MIIMKSIEEQEVKENQNAIKRFQFIPWSIKDSKNL